MHVERHPSETNRADTCGGIFPNAERMVRTCWHVRIVRMLTAPAAKLVRSLCVFACSCRETKGLMPRRSGKRQISIEPGYPVIETGSPTRICAGTSAPSARWRSKSAQDGAQKTALARKKEKSIAMFALIRVLHRDIPQTQALWGTNDDTYNTTDYYM